MELWPILTSAGSGVLAALLTFLATRRRTQVHERALYVEALDQLTGNLRTEIDRLNEDRRTLAQRVEELETRIAAYTETELELKRQVTELEKREQALLARVEQLEQELSR